MSSLKLIDQHLSSTEQATKKLKPRHKQIHATNLHIMNLTHEKLDKHLHMFRKSLKLTSGDANMSLSDDAISPNNPIVE
jgi:hypothetical protein